MLFIHIQFALSPNISFSGYEIVLKVKKLQQKFSLQFLQVFSYHSQKRDELILQHKLIN